MDIEKLIEQLKNLEAGAYGYHINGEVLGMDCSDFEQLMVDAAEEISRISTLRAENETLRAELERVKAERDGAIKDLNEFLSMDGLCPIQCEWCKWKDTFCDGKTPEWRGIKED